jgi:DsbC/DsbD-like thiol-disulfide interchange protein
VHGVTQESRFCLRIAVGAALWAVALVEPAGALEAVRASLVANSDRIEPGGTVSVGVLFELDPGWHIYWKNPGDSGLATEVLIEVPDGHTVGGIRWPAPIRFTQPGDLAGYGYEGSVLLAADVQLGQFPDAAGVPVSASASWLACKDVCVLGSAELAGRLPLEAAPERFGEWRASLPRAEPPFDLSMSSGLEPGERRGTVTLWLKWREPPEAVEFFADGGDSFKIAGTSVRSRGDLTRIDLEATAVAGDTAELRGVPAVVTAARPDGERLGWRIIAPIVSDAVETYQSVERRRP